MAHINRGIRLESAGRPEEALTAFLQAEKVYDTLPKFSRQTPNGRHLRSHVCFNLGLKFHNLDRLQEAEGYALESFKIAEALAQEYESVREYQFCLGKRANLLSSVRLRQRREDESERLVRQAVTVLARVTSTPEEELASGDELNLNRLFLIWILTNTERFREAAEIYRQALDLQTRLVNALPDQLNPIDFMTVLLSAGAELYHQKGPPVECERACRDLLRYQERLVRADPGSDEYRRFLAWWLADCPAPTVRDLPRAAELAQIGIDRNARNGWEWLILGAAQYRMQQHTKAQDSLGKAIPLVEKEFKAGTRLFLAMTQYRLGDSTRAQAEFRHASAWMDEHPAEVCHDLELRRLRAEARAVLGLPASPAAGAAKLPVIP